MLKPDYITIIREFKHRIPVFKCILYFGDNVEVFSRHEHMEKTDAVEWCSREYFGTPIYHVN